MPFLSGGPNAKYPADDVFLPVTRLHGKDIPRYGLFFEVTDQYQATEFAFDNCADFDQLIPEQVDRNFLISRYERLFEFQAGTEQTRKSTSLYYLVPWMAIPYTEVSGLHHFVKKDPFVLEVTSKSIYTKPPAVLSLTENSRKLQLISSSTAITAIWQKQENATTNRDTITGDVTTFKEKVLITIQDEHYTEIGEDILIKDITQINNTIENKIVGKLRIIFLQNLVQRLFLISVSKTPQDTFHFEPADTTLPPPAGLQSLESDDGSAHKRLIEDTKEYGFKQIGIEFTSGLIDLYVSDSLDKDKVIPFSTLEIPPDKRRRLKVNSLSDVNYYATLFVDRIRYAQSREDPTVKFNRYSVIYVFVTRFEPTELDPDSELPRWATGNTTINFIPLNAPKHSKKNISLTEKMNFQVKLGQPVSLSLLAGIGAQLSKEDREKLVDRDHLYATLCHELLHALSVGHIFRDYNAIAAMRYLNLYVINDYPLRNRGIEIKDLAYSHPSETEKRRLFDEIIDLGMNKAITDFIDSVFGPDGSPPQWKSPYTSESIGDQVVWLTLNSLASFRTFQTRNIMDYLNKRVNSEWSEPLTMPVPSPKDDLYYRRRTIWLNRFQWELARKAVAYFCDLPPP